MSARGGGSRKERVFLALTRPLVAVEWGGRGRRGRAIGRLAVQTADGLRGPALPQLERGPTGTRREAGPVPTQRSWLVHCQEQWLK